MLRLNFVNGDPCPELVGEGRISSYSNYFLSSDSTKWRGRVPHYEKVIAKEVWPGVDVEFRPCAEGVETLFRVGPGGDLSRIVLEYEGLEAPLRVDGGGNLVLSTSLGDLHEKAPFAYQVEGRLQKSVPVQFRLLSESRYGFTCEGADPRRELVIDPLVYGSFLGGEGPDLVLDLAVSGDGCLIIGGKTEADDFPVTPGAYQTETEAPCAFVCRLAPGGDSLVFSTYFGEMTRTYAVGADTNGCVYAGGGGAAGRAVDSGRLGYSVFRQPGGLAGPFQCRWGRVAIQYLSGRGCD
ncbi:hypothetical protein KJ815_01580 [bacterium]|nr:hypothetical protein [bacterium]